MSDTIASLGQSTEELKEVVEHLYQTMDRPNGLAYYESLESSAREVLGHTFDIDPSQLNDTDALDFDQKAALLAHTLYETVEYTQQHSNLTFQQIWDDRGSELLFDGFLAEKPLDDLVREANVVNRVHDALLDFGSYGATPQIIAGVGHNGLVGEWPVVSFDDTPEDAYRKTGDFVELYGTLCEKYNYPDTGLYEAESPRMDNVVPILEKAYENGTTLDYDRLADQAYVADTLGSEIHSVVYDVEEAFREQQSPDINIKEFIANSALERTAEFRPDMQNQPNEQDMELFHSKIAGRLVVQDAADITYSQSRLQLTEKQLDDLLDMTDNYTREYHANAQPRTADTNLQAGDANEVAGEDPRIAQDKQQKMG